MNVLFKNTKYNNLGGKNMYSDETQYTKVYHQVLFDTNTNPTEKVIYLIISAFDIKGTGIVDNLKHEKIAELAGMSTSTIKKVINSLVKKGYIVKHTKQQFNPCGSVVWNGTRNVYILPKKITSDRLLKLSTPVEIIPPVEQNLPPDKPQIDPKNENLSPSEGSVVPPNYSIDIDDDNNNIDKEISRLKETEGEDTVNKALTKMEKFTIRKNGFISYLKKTIETIKGEKIFSPNTYKKPSTYTYGNPKKKSTFNNFQQREYNFDNFWKMYRGEIPYDSNLLHA
jgi:hypothetical protein